MSALDADPSAYSLADFYIGESDSPLTPPEGFTEWRRRAEWATRLYDAKLVGPAAPRAMIAPAGGSATPLLNFASYNYLGLSRHPRCVAAAQDALQRYGTGICGPPLLSGMTDLQQQLEQHLNELLGSESTVVFSGGYSAAVGALSAILRKGDLAVADDRLHMSAIDGIKLAQARVVTFRHNAVDSLAALLEKHKGSRVLVITEGIYSVDGDMPPLREMLDVTEYFGVPLYLDEAHSVLGCGARGGGVAELLGVEHRVGLRLSTFSKAFAAVGGAISGSRETLDYMRFYANAYTFSACLPPATLASIAAAARISIEEPQLRERLWANGTYFRTKLNEIGVDTGPSTSYVVPIMIGSNRKLLYELCQTMRDRGLFIPPVDYPVVPQDQVRFRAAVTAAHTRQELDEALNIIEDTVVSAIGRRT
jgi:7-keto-8-aminopelargonate synthetase-like enzyme